MLNQCLRAGKCLICANVHPSIGQGLMLKVTTLVNQEQPDNNNQNLGGLRTGIAQCIDDLLKAKRVANRRERYVKSLDSYLHFFARGREDKPLADFTRQDVEDWLGKYSTAYSRQTWLNRISTLFSFAVRRNVVARNPCDQVERVTVDKKRPRILTPAEANLLLQRCPTLMIPYLTLAMFAGIRPEEVMRMKWEDIDLDTRVAFVDGKTRRARYVPLEPRAVKLLADHPIKTGPVVPGPAISTNAAVRAWRESARQLLGLPRFPQDLLRHTAASYLIALLGDAGKVAKRLGNSEKTLSSHYYAPMTDRTCAEFWRTEPPPEAAPPGSFIPPFHANWLAVSAPGKCPDTPGTPLPSPL
jgi:integrase/recombinase XerD